MSEISEKQIKDEELHNYPFDAEIFRNTFNGYVRRFNTIFYRFGHLDLHTFHCIRDCPVFRDDEG